jgi:hypothetical protein
MQLGTWVEFEVIVVKQPTAAGSQPATATLGRMRRGMVIGERPVYDVVAGSPPVLSNRRMTLLVAVSLHRCYRVFPEDARPAASLQPARRRAQAQARSAALSTTLTLAQTAAGATVAGRTPIAPADLELLVADQINRRTAAGDIFTAYDITLELRDAHPGLQIAHDMVRPVVHAQMRAIVASHIYDSETALFGGASALRYIPLYSAAP